MNKKSKSGFISMTLVYTFLILFMFIMLAILRTYTEKNKFLQAINDQIDMDINNANNSRISVINKIIDQNMPISDKEMNIKYFNISNSLYGNGNTLLYMDNDNILNYTDENVDNHTSRIYYFRGSVENNHIVFANMCFRMVRTNEDGSIRVRYNGVYKNGKCPTVNDIVTSISDEDASNDIIVSIGKSKFSNTLETIDFENSPIVTMLNEWYYNNIVKEHGDSFTNSVSLSSIYCYNRSLYKEGETFYKSKALAPKFINENDQSIYNESNVTNEVSFNCSNQEDRKNISNGLLYPVGLLTAQDIVLAGGYLKIDDLRYTKYPKSNTDYYLYTGSSFWTMSPYDESGKNIYVYANKSSNEENEGVMLVDEVTKEYDVIPVISIGPNIVIESGSGTSSNPFIVRK